MTTQAVKHRCAIAFHTVTALSLLACNAHAFESMQMGDWDIQITGNINAFLTNTECDPGAGVVAGGLACGSNGQDRDLGNVRTGLLPAFFSFHGTQETEDLTTEVMIGFQPGVDGGNQGAITGSPLD